MMRKYIFLFFCIVSVFTPLHAQNRITFNLGPGIFIYNSENSLKLMEDKKHLLYFPFGIQYKRNDVFGYNIGIEYSYNRSTKPDVLSFYFTDELGETLGKFGGDVILINHNFDFAYFGKISEYFSYGFGPTFVITNRILDINEYLYDKLASSGLGINGFVEVFYPFSNDNAFGFNSKLKFRYTHSIWFDEGLRDLSDYSQSIFTTELLVGFGYSF